jgi:hypothetical protein
MTNLTTEQNDLLGAWRTAKTALENAKETEMELRKQVQKMFFPTPEKGTQRVDLPMGYKLKLVHKINYNLGNNDLVNKALDEMAAVGNEGTFIAERLVTWKPSLSISEYNALSPQYKAIINKVLTTSDGAPTLEIEEPKAKKA